MRFAGALATALDGKGRPGIQITWHRLAPGALFLTLCGATLPPNSPEGRPLLRFSGDVAPGVPCTDCLAAGAPEELPTEPLA